MVNGLRCIFYVVDDLNYSRLFCYFVFCMRQVTLCDLRSDWAVGKMSLRLVRLGRQLKCVGLVALDTETPDTYP